MNSQSLIPESVALFIIEYCISMKKRMKNTIIAVVFLLNELQQSMQIFSSQKVYAFSVLYNKATLPSIDVKSKIWEHISNIQGLKSLWFSCPSYFSTPPMKYDVQVIVSLLFHKYWRVVGNHIFSHCLSPKMGLNKKRTDIRR